MAEKPALSDHLIERSAERDGRRIKIVRAFRRLPDGSTREIPMVSDNRPPREPLPEREGA